MTQPKAEHSLDAILITLVSLHYAYDPLSVLVGWTPRAWFYVFQGLTGAVLFFLLALVVHRAVPRGLCLWGCVEELLVAGCRAVQYPNPPPPVGYGEGICRAHGFDTYFLGLFVVAGFAFLVARNKRQRLEKRMIDSTSTAAAVTVGAAAGLAMNLPPPLVILCAVVGAVVQVWSSHSKDFVFTTRWVAKVLGLVFLYAAFGVFGSALIVTVGQNYTLTAGIATAPLWALAGALSIFAGVCIVVVRKRIMGEKDAQH